MIIHLIYLYNPPFLTFRFTGLVQLFTISATSSTKSADSGVTTTTLVNGRIQVFARPLGATTVVFALIVLLIGKVQIPNPKNSFH